MRWSMWRRFRCALPAIGLCLPLYACGPGDVEPSSALLSKWPSKSSPRFLSEIKHGAWDTACFLSAYDVPDKAMSRYYPGANSFAMNDGDVALAENEFAIAYINASARSIDIDRYTIEYGYGGIYRVKGESCVARSRDNVAIRPSTAGGEPINTLVVGNFAP